MTETDSISVKIFISYSWSSEDHQKWVLDLAHKLMSDGVEVILDRWDLKPGQDKYHFMEQMVKDETITKVLVICDRIYTEKADRREDTGVGTETQIISREVYSSVSQEKFIPVIKEKGDDGKPFIPVFMQTRIYVDLSDPQTYYENYEELLRNIYNKPLLTKPALGKPPAFITDQDKVVLETSHKLRAFKDAILAGKGYASGYAEDYLRLQSTAFDSVTLDKPDASGAKFTEHLLGKIDGFLDYKNEYADFILFTSNYCSDERIYSSIHAFFSRGIRFLSEYSNRTFYAHQFLFYEFFLYTMAGLIKHRRYNEAAMLLRQLYRDPSDTSGLANRRSLYGYGVFTPSSRFLDEIKSRDRRNERFYDPVAELIRKRIDPGIDISYMNIVEADYILFIRYILNDRPFSLSWMPRTLAYANDILSMPIFLDATSKATFEKMKVLLEVKDKADLVRRFEQLCEKEEIPRLDSIWGDTCMRHRNFINLDNLDTDGAPVSS